MLCRIKHGAVICSSAGGHDITRARVAHSRRVKDGENIVR